MNFGRKDKIFCIGRNKTGTTSMEEALSELGYKLGDQNRAEKLIKYYKHSDWKPIIKFCNTAEAFQDAPFSWPFTWFKIYEKYPTGKFILTIRNEEEWYNSQVNFHKRQFGNEKNIVDAETMKECAYNYQGYLYEMFKSVWKTSDDDLYNKDLMIKNYIAHNESIKLFFRDKTNLLILNVAEKNSYSKLCEFLNKEPLRQEFPHLNQSKY